jgi:hypothetical protein
MKIYLAAQRGTQQEMLFISDVLTSIGHVVTSSWIESSIPWISPEQMWKTPAFCSEFARVDFQDLERADMVAIFTCYGPSTTGGRHVELGMSLALRKRIAIVGPVENIFQTFQLPIMEHYDDWPHLARTLSREYVHESR